MGSFFGLEACEISAPQTKVRTPNPALEGKVLTAGLPRKPLYVFSKDSSLKPFIELYFLFHRFVMVPFCWSLSPNQGLFNKCYTFSHLFEHPGSLPSGHCFFHFIWRDSASGVLMLLVAFLSVSFCVLWNFSFQVISGFSIIHLLFLTPYPATEQLPPQGPVQCGSLLREPGAPALACPADDSRSSPTAEGGCVTGVCSTGCSVGHSPRQSQ